MSNPWMVPANSTSGKNFRRLVESCNVQSHGENELFKRRWKWSNRTWNLNQLLRRQRLNTCKRCPYWTWEWDILPEPSSVKFRSIEQAGPRGNDSKFSTKSISLHQRDLSSPKPHQVYWYDLVHPNFNVHTSLLLYLALAGHQIHARTGVYTR